MMDSHRLVPIVIVLAGCGGSGDGPKPDGTPPPDDGAGTQVQVTLLDNNGDPVAGRAVAFLAADDSVVSETATDASGVARAELAEGGSVTVAAAGVVGQPGLRPLVYTYLGVKPGDQLVIGQPKAMTPSTFEITVTVPASQVPAATNFFYNASCFKNAGLGTSSRTATLELLAGCTTADVYVEAQNDQLKPLGAAYASAQAVAAGTTIDMPGPYPAFTTSTLSVAHVESLTTVTPVVDLVIGGFYPMFSIGIPTEFELVDGAASRAFPIAAVPGAAVEARLLSQFSDGSQLYIARRAVPGDTMVDYLFDTLPRVTDRGSYDAATSQVGWSETGATAANAATVNFIVKDGTARDYQWVIVGPKAGATLHVPKLPASLAMFDVAAGDTVTVRKSAIGQFPGGYDQIRAHVFERLQFDNQLLLFDPFQGSDRRNRLDYVPNVGDTAVIASSN